MIERLSPLPPSAYHHPPIGLGIEVGVVGVSATLGGGGGVGGTIGSQHVGVSGGGGGGGDEGTPSRRARGLSTMSSVSNDR